jgi:hypothetical protein
VIPRVVLLTVCCVACPALADPGRVELEVDASFWARSSPSPVPSGEALGAAAGYRLGSHAVLGMYAEYALGSAQTSDTSAAETVKRIGAYAAYRREVAYAALRTGYSRFSFDQSGWLSSSHEAMNGIEVMRPEVGMQMGCCKVVVDVYFAYSLSWLSTPLPTVMHTSWTGLGMFGLRVVFAPG